MFNKMDLCSFLQFGAQQQWREMCSFFTIAFRITLYFPWESIRIIWHSQKGIKYVKMESIYSGSYPLTYDFSTKLFAECCHLIVGWGETIRRLLLQLFIFKKNLFASIVWCFIKMFCESWVERNYHDTWIHVMFKWCDIARSSWILWGSNCLLVREKWYDCAVSQVLTR